VKILGIVGSYRKDKTIDTLVSATLDEAEKYGAETEKIYLVDMNIEFCNNCRSCTQTTGTEPGKCVFDDDMTSILESYKKCDAVVIGAPVNFFSMNAITKTFLERLLPFTYWPWGARVPRPRTFKRSKKSILISSSSMPGTLGRIITGSMRSLKLMSRILGAKPVSTIFTGFAAHNEDSTTSKAAIRKARRAARKLVAKRTD